MFIIVSNHGAEPYLASVIGPKIAREKDKDKIAIFEIDFDDKAIYEVNEQGTGEEIRVPEGRIHYLVVRKIGRNEVDTEIDSDLEEEMKESIAQVFEIDFETRTISRVDKDLEAHEL